MIDSTWMNTSINNGTSSGNFKFLSVLSISFTILLSIWNSKNGRGGIRELHSQDADRCRHWYLSWEYKFQAASGLDCISSWRSMKEDAIWLHINRFTDTHSLLHSISKCLEAWLALLNMPRVLIFNYNKELRSHGPTLLLVVIVRFSWSRRLTIL